MESYGIHVVNTSEKVKRIADGYDVAMESITMEKNGDVSMKTEDGRIFITPERKYRNEFKSFMNNL